MTANEAAIRKAYQVAENKDITAWVNCFTEPWRMRSWIERFGCGIHGRACIRARSCRDAGKQFSAIGLMDLEDLIINSVSPLVTGKIAILLHVYLCGLHNT